MTNEDMKDQILAVAAAALQAGGYVKPADITGRRVTLNEADEIIVLATKGSGLYQFRYDEAEELKLAARTAAEEFNVDPMDYILYVAQGW